MASETFPRLPPLDSADAEEEWLFRLALRYYGEGNHIQAKRLLRSVIKKEGEFAEEAREMLRIIRERADELPFAAGVHLFGRGHYVVALDRFRQAVMLGGRRKAEALEYAERAASHIADRLRECTFAANLQLLDVSDTGDGRFVSLGGSPVPAARAEKVVVFDKSEFPFFSSPIERRGARPPVKTPAPSYILIRRTPHMSLGLVDLREDPVAQPGEHFSVFIYADDAPPRPGEEGTEVEFKAPPELSAFNLLVRLLVTDHFVIEDVVPAKTLVIKRGEVK